MKKNYTNLHTRILVNIIVILSLLSFISCTFNGGKNSQAPDKAVTSQISESTLRTKEVFDVKKYEGQLTIRYFDLKKDDKSGDSIFLISPDGKTMLVDTGMPETGPQIKKYLDMMNIKRIDYAVATHPHIDHIGGYPLIINSYDIGLAMRPNVPHSTDTYRKYISAITDKKLPVEYLEDGKTFDFGKEVKVEVLNPPKGTSPDTLPKEMSTSFINNHSAVLKFTYKNRTFLLTGDIYSLREAEMATQKADLLDVDFMDAPHHGGETSSSGAFITRTTPEYVVMSINVFKTKSIYDRYKKSGTKNIYVTGIDGSILVASDGDKINIITEKDRIGNYLK